MTPHNLLDQLKKKSLLLDGQRVVQDQEVAALYGVTLTKLRSLVKQNPERFPPSLLLKRNGRLFLTDAGVLMLSSVIKNPQADEVSVGIIRELFSFQNN